VTLSVPGASPEHKYEENSNLTTNHVFFVQFNAFKFRVYKYSSYYDQKY